MKILLMLHELVFIIDQVMCVKIVDKSRQDHEPLLMQQYEVMTA